MSTDAELTNLVHHTVSSTDELITSFEKLLESPQETYIIPREALAALQSILSINVLLTRRLFEENQTMLDRIDELLRKHNLK